MDIQKELNEWADWFIPHDSKDLRDALELNSFNQLNVDKLLAINGLSETYAFRAKDSWKAWQAAKAQAVQEGFVLVEREKLAMIFEIATNALVYHVAPPKHDALSIIQGIARKAMIEAQEPAND